MNRVMHGETAPVGGRNVTPIVTAVATVATLSAVLSGFVSSGTAARPSDVLVRPVAGAAPAPLRSSGLLTSTSLATPPAATPASALKPETGPPPRLVAPHRAVPVTHPLARTTVQTVASARPAAAPAEPARRAPATRNQYVAPPTPTRESPGTHPPAATQPAPRSAPAPRHTSAPHPSGYTDEPGIASAVLAAINDSRSAHGLAAVSYNSLLVQSAHAHNVAMANANMMSHQVPGEPDLGARISATGKAWVDADENVGWCLENSTSAALMLHKIMMGEGPPPPGQTNHYSNILDPEMRTVGVDVIWDADHGKLWLTEDFANE